MKPRNSTLTTLIKLMKSRAILILLLSLSVNLMAQKTDSIASKVDLNEIVVTARKTTLKGDHELIFMSDKNRSFGTNALDAVSSLAQFKTDINASNLLSADRKSVYVLIKLVSLPLPMSSGLIRVMTSNV